MTDPLVGCYCVKNWDQQQCGSKETVTTNAEFGHFTVPKLHQRRMNVFPGITNEQALLAGFWV